jgi:hypothetical protein
MAKKRTERKLEGFFAGPKEKNDSNKIEEDNVKERKKRKENGEQTERKLPRDPPSNGSQRVASSKWR